MMCISIGGPMFNDNISVLDCCTAAPKSILRMSSNYIAQLGVRDVVAMVKYASHKFQLMKYDL